MSLSLGKRRGIARLADGAGRFKMIAIDQRPPLEALIKRRRGVDAAAYDDMAAVKATLAGALAPQASAMLIDPIYDFPRCAASLGPQQGLLVTLEHAAFEESPGGRRSLLREQGKAIHIFPGEPFQRGDQVGADALRHDLKLADHLVIFPHGPAVGAHGHARHRFDAPGHDQLLPTGAYFRGRQIDRLQPRSAETVELDAGNIEIPPGVERRGSGDVAALLLDGRHAAQQHVVDLRGIQIVAPAQFVEERLE